MRTALAFGGVLLAAAVSLAQPPAPAKGYAVLKVQIRAVKVEKEQGADGKTVETAVFELETLKGEKLAEARIPKNKTWTFKPKGKSEVVQSVERVIEQHKKATAEKPATVWAFGRDTANGKPDGIVIHQFYHEDVSAKWGEQQDSKLSAVQPPKKQPEPAAPKVVALKAGDKISLAIPKKGETVTLPYEGGKAMTITFTATPPAKATVTYKLGLEDGGKIVELDLPTQKGARRNVAGKAAVGLTEDQKAVKLDIFDDGPAKVPVRVIVSNEDSGIKVLVVPDLVNAK